MERNAFNSILSYVSMINPPLVSLEVCIKGKYVLYIYIYISVIRMLFSTLSQLSSKILIKNYYSESIADSAPNASNYPTPYYSPRSSR